MALVRSRRPSDTASEVQPAAKRVKDSTKFPWTWKDRIPDGNFMDYFKSPIVDIRVGPDLKLFQVHKAALVKKADYFKKLFDGGFIEATTKAAEFPEDDEEAWEALIQWSYTGTVIDCLAETESFNESSSGADLKDTPRFYSMIKLTCLAEKYCITDLHNRAVDRLVKYMVQDRADAPFFSWQAYQEVNRYVYNHSGEGAPTRRLFTTYFVFLMACSKDICKSTYEPDKMLSLATEIPDLMSDFFIISLQNRDSAAAQPLPWKMDRCTFHVHSPGVADCPRAFGGESSFKVPSLEADVHYVSKRSISKKELTMPAWLKLVEFLGFLRRKKLLLP